MFKQLKQGGILLFTKGEVIDKVWQYSKYHGNLLSYCESLAKAGHGNGFATLIFLFNIVENIMKDSVKDYDSGFLDVLKKVKKQNLINYKESTFLNAPNNSIRKLRNILAHSNLSKYSVVYIEDGREIYYPLTEEESCLKVYETISEVSFNIILKVISINFTDKIEIDLSQALKDAEIHIKEHTPEELLQFKGLEHIAQQSYWQSLNENDRYRLVENSSDVNVLTYILSGLKEQGLFLKYKQGNVQSIITLRTCA